MAAKNPTYDLVLLLDTSVDDSVRTKVLSDTEATIRKHGEVVGTHDWGVRATAYEIRKRKDAEYHLIQFHATRELLETLERTLRITDGVQRFRIIKLAPGTPAPPDGAAMAASPVAEEPAPV
jgi:small subunit ribosomal protein S6